MKEKGRKRYEKVLLREWYFPEKNLLQIVPKKEKIPYKNVEKNQLTNVEIYEKINTGMDVKEITNLTISKLT